MKLKIYYFLFLILLTKAVSADTYPEVIFDNSLVKGSYAKSQVTYFGNSWVENVNRNLLVSDTLFFTPGNSLSLKYISNPIGHWSAEVKYSRQKFHYRVSKSDFLTVKIFVQSNHTSAQDLPKIALQQGSQESQRLSLVPYIDDFQHNMWISVRIPVKDFVNLQFENPISAVVFSENKTSMNTHHLFVDQIEFLPQNYSNTLLSSPAILSKTTAYDQQIHLQWQLPLTPSIRYIKIYRSDDNVTFDPVAIRPIYMQGSLDYLPELNKTYYYKIAWVDYNYKESPFSAVQEVKTKVLNNDQLLDLIQFSHINYFLENYDINSGMYLPYRIKDKPIVSLKETGYALLSMIVGVEKGFIPKSTFANRINRIAKFLGNAQNRYGIFPAYFDGRKGLPEYVDDKPTYDVLATTSIIQALLLSKQYLKKDAQADTSSFKQIDELWNQIEWTKLTVDHSNDVLKSELSGVSDQFNLGNLGGINESMNAYMLAMGSTSQPLPLSAYENGVRHVYDNNFAELHVPRDSVSQAYSSIIKNLELKKDSAKVEAINGIPAVESNGNLYVLSDEITDSIAKISIYKDTIMYGLDLKFGDLNRNLLKVYTPFFTINPNTIKEGNQNYTELLNNFTKAIKRRDNEIGVGTTNSEIWGFYQRRDSTQSFRINPAIGASSMFLNKELGLKTLLALYKEYADVLFTEYGFRAYLDLRNSDVSDEYMALNQASVAILIENSRSGLIWNLYKEIPEIKKLESKLFSAK
ncbi:glucoamylase family protein [Sphingobacterium hungaricum]